MKQQKNFILSVRNEIQTMEPKSSSAKPHDGSAHSGKMKQRSHWSLRLWRMMAFTVSLSLCGASIQNIWSKWNEDPKIMNFIEKSMSISSIPFPTATICPQTKVSANKLNSIMTKKNLNSWLPFDMSERDKIILEALAHVCPYLPPWLIFKNKFTNDSIYDIFNDITPHFEHSCLWQNEMVCSEYSNLIFTEEGQCITFNNLNRSGLLMEQDMLWSLENGYKSGLNGSEYPLRSFDSGRESALIATFQLYERDIEYFCQGTLQGFKFFLNTPGEALKLSQHYYLASPLENTFIMIEPKIVTTSKNLHDFEPNERQCFFSYEHQLRFFNTYTQSNCELECLANFTTIECGCVKFSMPRDNNTKICGGASIKCYQSAQKILFKEALIEDIGNKTVRIFREKCNCLPTCTTITYNAEIEITKFITEDSIMNSNRDTDDNTSSVQMARVHIFFKDRQVETLQRMEVYRYTDLWLICGSLFGLFLGVSLLFEHIYHITLRLYTTLSRSRAKNSINPFERKIVNTVSIDMLNDSTH